MRINFKSQKSCYFYFIDNNLKIDVLSMLSVSNQRKEQNLSNFSNTMHFMMIYVHQEFTTLFITFANKQKGNKNLYLISTYFTAYDNN